MVKTSKLAFVLFILNLVPSMARWNATGNLKTIWVTHVMEYRDLFSSAQVEMFAADVKEAYADFMEERSDPAKRRVIKPQAEHTSTPADKDRLNEEFFNYQGRHPVNEATLETVWQAFCYAVSKFISEANLPPIAYEREILQGGSLEWVDTSVGMPRRGRQYCWGSVQSQGMHHDIHTHPGAALAGTLYLEVPGDGGALTLSDPRGPLPPFNYAYRIAPEEGMFVLFPATLPHGVHSTPGPVPRVSISCNFPGDWQKYTTAKTIVHESSWSHEMMTPEDAMEEEKKKKDGEL